MSPDALSGLWVGLLALAIGGLCAGGGFAAGALTAPGPDDATDEQMRAFDDSFAEAQADAAEASRERGSRSGASDGTKLGDEAGSAAGSEAGEEQAAEDAPSTDPADYPLGTIGPAPEGTYCPPPYSYDRGVCVISRPAQPDECPPGQVPVGVTGACARP